MRKIKEIFSSVHDFGKKYNIEIKQGIKALIIACIVVIGAVFLGGVFNRDVFSWVSAFLQYLTVILALLAWFNTRMLLSARERQHVMVNSKDLILTIGLSREIEADVKKYINSQKGTDAVLGNLEEINLSGTNKAETILTPDNSYMYLQVNETIKGTLSIKKIKDMPEQENDLADYINELQKCISKVMDIMGENANDKLHVFMAAPVEIGAYVTPFFTNKKTVIMYRYMRDLETKYIKMEPVRDRINQ